MKFAVAFVFALAACVSGDATPVPYTVASPAPYTNDHVQAVANQYVEHYGAEGYNLQPGYEGYLVPAAEHSFFPLVEGLDLKSHGLIPKVLKHIIALGLKVLPKIIIGAVVVGALFLIGGCVNAFICTFTPICTISFWGHGFNKETMRSYLTPDKISSTANFVADAIKKYKDMYETLTNEIDTGKKLKKK